MKQRTHSHAGQTFLAESSKILSSSLELKSIWDRLTTFLVHDFCDGCIIDIFSQNATSLEPLNVAHYDPQKKRLLMDIRKTHAPTLADGWGTGAVLLSGKPFIEFCTSKEQIRLWARDERHFCQLTELELRSIISVPILLGHRAIGTMTMLMTSLRKQFNHDDLSFAEELARRVAVTMENAQLYERVIRANEAKSLFLANMSHEMRTPLAAILGFTDLALTSRQSENEIKNSLHTIKKNAEQLFKLINDLLDLSKIEADKLEIEKSRFSLLSLISDLRNMFEHRAAEKKLAIEFIADTTLPETIVSDESRLRQIFINLLNNAIKFTETGFIHIRISYSEDSHYLKVRTQDTGIGIAKKQVPKLFQPFVQGDGSMTRRFGGTGLGLTISRKLSRALGGDLSLEETHEGRGTTFCFFIRPDTISDKRILNLGIDEFPKEHLVVEKRILDPQPLAGTLRGLRILLVDDCAENLYLVSHYLRSAEALVDLAVNGLEAIEKAKEQIYSVILMDIQMPKMNGYEATLQLRRQGILIPIVALTAHAMSGERDLCLGAGCTDHLTKPIDRHLLIDKVREYGFSGFLTGMN